VSWCGLYVAEELLGRLGISRHAAALEAEGILAASDLTLLSRDDCKELGLSIGERNRVADWAARAVRLALLFFLGASACVLGMLFFEAVSSLCAGSVRTEPEEAACGWRRRFRWRRFPDGLVREGRRP
jgi:hypothetical protein